MRICGKRVSAFTQGELHFMKYYKKDFHGNPLTPGQIKEVKKVYDLRNVEQRRKRLEF